MKYMKNKKLIYKATYENISSNKEIPDLSIEDIREILLKINKGIVWGTTMPPYDHNYKIQNFDVNFRSELKETRKDITFCYKYKYEIIDSNSNRIIGYRLGIDVQKVDIVTYFTKIKENKTEHLIYQIGGRYSESLKILDKFKEKVEQETQDYSTHQLIQYYEKIKTSEPYDNLDYQVKLYILKNLEKLYFINNNTSKTEEIFEEMKGLRFIENLEIEQIKKIEPISSSKIKNDYKFRVKDILDLTKINVSDEFINDLQKNITEKDILNDEKKIFEYSVKMIEQTDNSLIIISNEFLLNLLQTLSEYAYQKKYTKFLYITSTDLKSYGELIKNISALGNIKIDIVKFESVIYFVLRDFKEILFGKENKVSIVIKDESLIKKFISIVENYIKLEKSFNIILKESFPEVEEIIQERKQESVTTLIYKAIFKNIYSEDNLPKIIVEDIKKILIKDPRGIPNVLDYKERKHPIKFRDVLENTRMDFTFYYANIINGFESGEFNIVQVDLISFFTKSKIPYQYTEHRIYQIGDRQILKDEFTFNIAFNLADLYYVNENVDVAIKLYKNLLEVYPDNFDVLVNLGLSYVSKKDYEKAIELYKKALEIKPNDAIVWKNLGITYENYNQFDKAKNAYKKAYELDPKDSEIKDHLKNL